MTINLPREAIFHIDCGNWCWTVEKKVGCMMEQKYALFI